MTYDDFAVALQECMVSVWIDDESTGYKYTVSWAATTFPLEFFTIDDNIVWFGTDTESDSSVWDGYQGTDPDTSGDKLDWFYKSISTDPAIKKYSNSSSEYDNNFYFKREKLRAMKAKYYPSFINTRNIAIIPICPFINYWFFALTHFRDNVTENTFFQS